MSYASAKEIDLDKVPIIDITPLRNGSDPHKVAQELYKASTGLGFIYIKGHGIPESKINSLRNDGLKFFIYFVLPAFMIIAVIIFLIFAPNPYENCEEVTWYEYGEKKTGIICDDDAKARMESIREEMGVYKKKE